MPMFHSTLLTATLPRYGINFLPKIQCLCISERDASKRTRFNMIKPPWQIGQMNCRSKWLPAAQRILFAFAVSVAIGKSAATARTLSFPFAVPGPANTDGQAICPPAPEPVIALETVQPYRTGDATFSQLDPAKSAIRESQIAPVKAFTYRVTRWANAYVANGGQSKAAGECALRWLDAWASAGAMTKMSGHDAHWLRILYLTAWASDFAQVSKLEIGSPDPRLRIRQWLAALARDMQTHFDSLPAASTVRSNNHRYWAGVAAVAVAADTDNEALFDWGIRSARVGLDQITTQGTLPLEIGRASRARHYSIYAAQALSLVAEYAAANGIDLYEANDRALRRLVIFSLQSIWQPKAIEAMANAKQEEYKDKSGQIYTQGLAWLEYYARRFPGDIPNNSVIFSHRPLINDEIGGNITLLTKSR